jgi:hypothetical protein
MANVKQEPWAILLCRFSDDPNDPSQTRVMDLAAQWRAKGDQNFIMANLNPSWDADNRTILALYEVFFTITGIFTFNVVQYFDAMSHGLVDVTGNKVFPCKLNLTAAEGLALANNPGGKEYQDGMFKRAKDALLQQYGINWKDFYGIAVSFQSPDFGSQGGVNYDGGPGVYMDIRYVVNNGTQRWGHEMGHGFGLGHSRTDGVLTSNCTGGDPSDYTDPWDIMSVECAFSAADNDYGMRGPGMNAWNMRHMQGLDESRIWKGSNNTDFSETIVLNPLHWRYKAGFLGAEIPGIGPNSAYLVEFRTREFWDAAIPQPQVIVHRFEDVHSYIMKGTKGQKSLSAGDVFQSGSGPFSRVQVLSIDAANNTATVRLCYSLEPIVTPSVKINFEKPVDPCVPDEPVAGSEAKFVFELSNVICNMSYQVLWSVSGTSPLSGQLNTGSSFSIWTPDPPIAVTVSVTIFFDDGTIITDAYPFHSIDQATAGAIHFFCENSRKHKLRVIPWWEWDLEKLRTIANDYSREELKLIEQRTEKILQTVRQLNKVVR